MKPPISATTEEMCTHRTTIRSTSVGPMLRVYKSGFRKIARRRFDSDPRSGSQIQGDRIRRERGGREAAFLFVIAKDAPDVRRKTRQEFRSEIATRTCTSYDARATGSSEAAVNGIP